MAEITREEHDAKLAATEARIEATETRINASLEAVTSELSKLRDEFRIELKHLPTKSAMVWTVVTSAIASVVAIVGILYGTLSFVGDRSDNAAAIGATIGEKTAANNALIDEVRQEGREARTEINKNTQQILEAIRALETRTNEDAATK